MNFFENITGSLSTIWANKMRSGLTMLGIIIGIFSVVVMIGIGQGAQAGITESLQSMGTNALFVTGGGNGSMRSFMRGGGSGTLKLSDYETLQDLDLISGVTPEASGNSVIIYGTENTSASITGVLPNYFELKDKELLLGNLIMEENEIARDRVMVIDEQVIADLGMDANPVGEKVRIGDSIYTILGVIEGEDGNIFIPFSTGQLRLFGSKAISMINVFVADENDMDIVEANIEKTLLAAHHISDADDADFSIMNQADMLEAMNEMTQIFTILLGGIAGISLLVGGIGVMNIMLVSVTERTREIGIRKAVGAHRNNILLQFLTESIILSLLGGAIAIGMSFIAADIISGFGLTVLISNFSLMLGFGFSMGVGIIFGILPAYNASRLTPIDALRFE